MMQEDRCLPSKDWIHWNNHFEFFFQAHVEATIAEVIHIAQLFPRMVNDEERKAIIEDIFQEDLKSLLRSFSDRQDPLAKSVGCGIIFGTI